MAVLTKWSAINYACVQFLYYSRPWKEAYNEYLTNLVFIIAKMHKTDEADEADEMDANT